MHIKGIPVLNFPLGKAIILVKLFCIWYRNEDDWSDKANDKALAEDGDNDGPAGMAPDGIIEV